jgi:hypothetical protein
MSKASASVLSRRAQSPWLTVFTALTLGLVGCGGGTGTTDGSAGSGGRFDSNTGGNASGGAAGGGSESGGSASGTAGTGGASDTPSNQTDEYVARRIAGTARNMMIFLWNRDMVASLETEFAVGEACLLTGSYSALVLRTFLDGSCDGSSTLDITMNAEQCEHDWGVEGESVIFNGVLDNQATQTYAGTCSLPESQSATFTATGLTVTYQRTESVTGEVFEKTFEDCDLELDYTLMANSGQGTLSGRACGQDVVIEYDQ